MSRKSKERRGAGGSRTAALDWSSMGNLCGDCNWHDCDADERDGEERPRCFGAKDGIDPEKLARAHALDGKVSDEFPDGTRWAQDCVWSMQLENPWPALEVLRLAAEAATTDWERCKLGCGNLESLLGNHGALIISAVERYACESVAFRDCLSHVWQHGMPDDVWHRVLKASGREPARSLPVRRPR